MKTKKDKKLLMLFVLAVLSGIVLSLVLSFLIISPYLFILLLSILFVILLLEDSLARKLKLSQLFDKSLSAIIIALYTMQLASITQIQSLIMWIMGIASFFVYIGFSVIVEKFEK